jgi:hypothetical protein
MLTQRGKDAKKDLPNPGLNLSQKDLKFFLADGVHRLSLPGANR